MAMANFFRATSAEFLASTQDIYRLASVQERQPDAPKTIPAGSLLFESQVALELSMTSNVDVICQLVFLPKRFS